MAGVSECGNAGFFVFISWRVETAGGKGPERKCGRSRRSVVADGSLRGQPRYDVRLSQEAIKDPSRDKAIRRTASPEHRTFFPGSADSSFLWCVDVNISGLPTRFVARVLCCGKISDPSSHGFRGEVFSGRSLHFVSHLPFKFTPAGGVGKTTRLNGLSTLFGMCREKKQGITPLLFFLGAGEEMERR